jgi:hypothetical protein
MTCEPRPPGAEAHRATAGNPPALSMTTHTHAADTRRTVKDTRREPGEQP